MILTKPGRDLITIDESIWSNKGILPEAKIHLIKLKFEEPTVEKMNWVFKNFSLTNRFIIADNIKFYNWVFKPINKKYYVENQFGDKNIFSFFKKNNKILLNFNNLPDNVLKFVLDPDVFSDILQNLEIVEINNNIYLGKRSILHGWTGNVVMSK